MVSLFHRFTKGVFNSGIPISSQAFSLNTQVISTVAGNGTSGLNGDGGAAASSGLCGPKGRVVDSSGNLFIADGNNDRVPKVSNPTITPVTQRNFTARHNETNQVNAIWQTATEINTAHSGTATLPTGKNSFRIHLSALPKGSYRLVVEGNGEKQLVVE